MKIGRGFLTSEMLLWIGLALIFVITFSHFIYIGFTTCDDYYYYCRYFNDKEVWKNSYQMAKEHSRFYLSLTMPPFAIYGPFLGGYYFSSRILTLLFTVAGILLFAESARRVLGVKGISYLVLLLYIVFVCIATRNTPITAFPLYFAFSWFLFQASLYFYIRFLQSQLHWYKVLAVTAYGFVILFYEMYLPFVLIYPLLHFIVAFRGEVNGTYLKQMIRSCVSFFALVVLYAAIYIAFKVWFASGTYVGVKVSREFSLSATLNTLWQLTKGAFPFQIYLFWMNVINGSRYLFQSSINALYYPFYHLQLDWIIKGLLVAGIYLLVASKLNKKVELTVFQKSVGFVLMLLLIFLPSLLLAFTNKYQEYTAYGLYHYLPTYYSSFGVYLLLAVLLHCVLSYCNNILRGIVNFVVAILLMASSIITDFANQAAEQELGRIYRLFEDVDGFLKSSISNDLKSKPALVFAPTLYECRSSLSYYDECGFDWSHYFEAKTGNYIRVVRDTVGLGSSICSGRYEMTYSGMPKGHLLTLSSFHSNTLQAKRLFLKTDLDTVTINSKKFGVQSSRRVEIEVENQYQSVPMTNELIQADSIWVSE